VKKPGSGNVLEECDEKSFKFRAVNDLEAKKMPVLFSDISICFQQLMTGIYQSSKKLPLLV